MCGSSIYSEGIKITRGLPVTRWREEQHVTAACCDTSTGRARVGRKRPEKRSLGSAKEQKHAPGQADRVQDVPDRCPSRREVQEKITTGECALACPFGRR